MALLPSGLQDTLSPYAAHDRFITSALLDRFALFGYAQVNPPLLEFESSLLAGKGAAYQHNSFRVMDNISQQMMAIRADITPQIERIALQMLAGQKQSEPLRLCYAGQVLRVGAANMGEKRQLRQAGLELIGTLAQISPLEVLIAAIEALQTIGLSNIVVSVSCGGILEDLLGEAENDALIIKAIAHKDIGALPADTPNRAAIIALLEHNLAVAKEQLSSEIALKIGEVENLIAKVLKNCITEDNNLEVYADILDVSAFPYHLGACFTLLDKASRLEVGRGGCYQLSGHLQEEYYGCGATLYVDNLLGADLNYPDAPAIKHLSDEDFFTNGRDLRKNGVVTLLNLIP